MPRQPDSGLEERILHAADVLWRRGGERALTMRAVARAAKTNTPAVYRRFNDREDLLRGLLLRIAGRIRQEFARGETLEQMSEAYIEYALKMPHDYELFYSHARALSPQRTRRAASHSRIPSQLRFCRAGSGAATGRLSRGSHRTRAATLGALARHHHHAPGPLHSRRA